MTELSISDPRDFPNVTVYWRPGPIYRIAFKNREFARGGQAALRGLMGLIAVLGVLPTAVAFGIYSHFFFGAWYYGAGFIIILFLGLCAILWKPSLSDRSVELDPSKDSLRVLRGTRVVLERPLSRLQNLTVEPNPEAEQKRLERMERGDRNLSEAEREHCLFGWFGMSGAEKVLLFSRAEWPNNNSLFEVRQAILWAREHAQNKPDAEATSQARTPSGGLAPPLD